MDEAFARLTPADLRQVDASEPAKSAVKLIGLAAEKKPLTPSEFLTVRDYLLMTTLYENGSRPGPLENALLSHFKQATYSASNDRYTILVDKHKTTRHHGPAELTVTSRIYSYLQIYVLYVRPQFAAAGEDALFVKEDGYAFRHGTIGKRVTQFFQQAGIRKDVRVTATNIRKMITDKAYELSPTKKRLIHGHMKHQERTADSNYVIQVNAERAVKAHELVHNIIQDPSTSKPAEPSPAVGQEEDDNDDKPLGTVFGKQPSNEDDDDDLPLAVALRKQRTKALESSDESDEKSARVSVASLGDEYKSVLMTVFHNEISTGRLLTMNEVRTKMRAHLFLRKMVVQPDFVKKVADFVRYKTNLTHQLQMTHLNDLDDPDCIASLTIESGPRKLWSAHDAAVIEAKFKSHKKFPGKKEILQLFSNDDVLSHILEREGAVRCYEKVKTLFKRSSQ